MNIDTVMSAMDPGIAYNVVFSFSQTVLTFITPVLFLIAVFIRIMETQLDGLTSGGKWGQALKDIFIWGTAIAVYFGVFGLIAAFVNPIYAWIEQTGSVSAITDRFNEIIALVKAKRGEQSYVEFAFGITAVPIQIFSVAFYLGTLALAATFTLLLKIAHAFGFGVVLVWGLIAIPMSITSNLKLLRGWALMAGFILAWPLVQGLMISLFAPIFQHAADQLIKDISTNVEWNVVSVHVLFGISHLLLAAILVAAPLIAVYLTANAPSGGALVMPFAAAAVGAVAAAAKGKHRIPWKGSAASSAAVTPLQSGPRMLSGNRNNSVNDRSAPPHSGGMRPLRVASVGGEAEHSGTAPTASTSEPSIDSRNEGVHKKKQARRGAILNHKKKTQVNPK